MSKQFLSVLLQAVICVLAYAATCPEYKDIRTPAVDADKLNINEIHGIWYLVATTEPTTKFCLCNVMDFSIFTKTYTYTDTCFQDVPHTTPTNFTLSIGGDLSYDPASPGILHEGFKVHNHTVTAKKPNMLFDLHRNTHGDIVLAHFYACLGKVVPIVGQQMFSYLLYARDPWITQEEIKALVTKDNRTHPGAFQLDGYVVTGPEQWKQCGVLPNTSAPVNTLV